MSAPLLPVPSRADVLRAAWTLTRLMFAYPRVRASMATLIVSVTNIQNLASNTTHSKPRIGVNTMDQQMATGIGEAPANTPAKHTGLPDERTLRSRLEELGGRVNDVVETLKACEIASREPSDIDASAILRVAIETLSRIDEDMSPLRVLR